MDCGDYLLRKLGYGGNGAQQSAIFVGKTSVCRFFILSDGVRVREITVRGMNGLGFGTLGLVTFPRLLIFN